MLKLSPASERLESRSQLSSSDAVCFFGLISVLDYEFAGGSTCAESGVGEFSVAWEHT